VIPVIREWLRRLWGTFRKAPEDAVMAEELRLHLDMLAADLQRRGLTPEEALRQARRQAGGVAQVMDQRRDQRGLPWLEDLLQDARFGARMLRRAPLVTAVALLTLTLAIGANTAIFSLVDPLLFRDLPVRDPASLVQFTFQYPRDPPLNMFGLANYEQYRDRNRVFSDLFGLAALTTESRAGEDSIAAEVVTGNFFQALGVGPALGRVLDVSDDKPGAAAAVVSWRYWKNRFNGDPRVLGSAIDIQDTRVPAPMQVTVVGVAEPGFSGIVVGYRPDVWISFAAVPDAMRSRAGLALAARLKPGVSIEQARAEMRVLDRARIDGLAQRDPQWLRVVIDVTPARTGLSTPLHQQFGGPLLLLMTMVGGVLLLACVNIGSLLLARGAAREQEMAVRVSLGAGRFRIVRQVLTESLLLAAMGGVLGIVGARFGATMLMRIMMSGTRSPGPSPHLDIPLDARVLMFTVAVTVLAALLFGLMPAIAAFVSAPAPALRQTGAAQPRSRRAFGNGLVVAQVAISLALLSVSQLSIAHLRHLRDRSLGFDRNGVLLISIDTSRAQNRQQLAALYRDIVPRLEAIPGVRSVAASGTTPISLGAASRFLRAEGLDEPVQDRQRVSVNWVSPNYFATYGTPLRAGRDFRDADFDEPRRVIVNEALARRYFAGRDPIGFHVWLENERDPYEVVGVAGDAKYQDIRVPAPPIVYLFAPMSRGSTTLSLRTDINPIAVAADARRTVTQALGTDSVGRVTTLAEQVNAAVVPERLMAILGGFFGVVGALLAAVGLYGLLAYTVTRQTKEIGIRMALGATRGEVMRMMLRRGLTLVAVGFVVGAPVAFWGTRFAATAIEGIPGGGVPPVATAALAMLVVAALASFVPAHRATRVQPVIALRSE
jgi:predicted permease